MSKIRESQKNNMTSFSITLQSIVRNGRQWFLSIPNKIYNLIIKISNYARSFFKSSKAETTTNLPKSFHPSDQFSTQKIVSATPVTPPAPTILPEKQAVSSNNPQLIEIKNSKLEVCISNIRKIRTDKKFIPSLDEHNPTRAANKVMKMAGLKARQLGEGMYIGQCHYDKKLVEKKSLVLVHGAALTAHGIETGKGGITNLLNIMLEGLNRSQWWGALQDGDPSYSAGAHGPYYVIIDSDRLRNDEKQGLRLRPKMIDEVYHLAYLVPSSVHRDFLFKAIEKALEIKMLTQEEGQRLKSQIITYSEFMLFPKSAVKDNGSFAEHLKSEEFYQAKMELGTRDDEAAEIHPEMDAYQAGDLLKNDPRKTPWLIRKRPANREDAKYAVSYLNYGKNGVRELHHEKIINPNLLEIKMQYGGINQLTPGML